MPTLLIAILVLVSSAVCFAPCARAADPVFEPPVPLAADATTDTPGGSDRGPNAATDGAGTWVVAWNGNAERQTFGLDDDIFFARSTDGGLTFSAQQPLNNDAVTDNGGDTPFDAGPDDQKVSIAAGSNGRFIAVWSRMSLAITSGFLQMARSSDGGATWTNPATLLTGVRDPAIATDGAGTWVVVWLQPLNTFFESDLYFSRSTDDGVTFSPPQHLNTDWSTDAIFETAPTLAYSGGVWIVGWQAWLFASPGIPSPPLHPGVLYSRSTDGGVTWSATAGIDGTGGPAEFRAGAPRLAGDGSGGWVATWTVENDATRDADVLVASSSDGGVTWSAPQTLSANSTPAERRNAAARVAAGTPGTYVVTWVRGWDDVPYEVRTSTSTDGGATWSADHTIYSAGTNGPAGPAQIVFGSALAHDPAGHWLAIWSTNDTNIASGTKGNDFDLVMSISDLACGNGVLDAGETCDDGDRGALDCCGRTCGFDAADAVCAADADPCTLERCDGAGTCGHQMAPIGTRCAADADLCTFDRCDGAGGCAHVFEPQNDCRVSTRLRSSKLGFSTKGTPESQRLQWKWSRGELAPFTLFIFGEDYALCIYDDAGLAMRADAPAGTCDANGKSCWNPQGSSLKYKDKDATPNGITTVLLTPADNDKTKMSMTGKGANLVLPTAALTGPVTAQLVGIDHGCWTSTYSTGIKRNDGSTFKATSD